MPPTEHRRSGRHVGAARTAATLTLVGLLVVLLGGAGWGGEAASAPGPSPAYVRTAHLLTGLGPVDVRLTPFSAEGGSGATESARTTSYGAVDSYGAVTPESYAVTVRLSDGARGDDPLLTGTVTFAPGRAYTVVALGPADDPRLHLLDDDLTPPPSGQAEVRLFSAVPRAAVALDGGAVVEQVPPAPGTGYVPVPAGDRLLEVSDGTSSTSVQVGLDSRSSYTVFVRPGPEGALGVQAVLDQAGAEQVPVGGVATGGGWAAQQGPSTTAPTLVLLATGLALAAVVVRTVLVRRRAAVPQR